jgi:hypothetical protein
MPTSGRRPSTWHSFIRCGSAKPDGRHGLEFDGKVSSARASDKAASLRFGAATIEVSGSKIFIESAVFEHVIGRVDDGGGDGADRFLRPSSTALSPAFSRLYSREGRPSIPPERLLRALLLQAFYTVRSERR